MNIGIKRRAFNPTHLAYMVLFYISLATGSVIPFISFDLQKNIVAIVLFFGVLFCAFKNGQLMSRILSKSFFYIGIAFVLYLLMCVNAHDPELVKRRVEGGFSGTLICVIFFTFSIRYCGVKDTFQNFVIIAFAMLLLTIAYKINFGFSDRNVRFLFNGPIVFGWLMGSAAVVCFAFIFFGEKSKIYYLLFAAFVVAILWSASKGPLIATVATTIYIFISVGKVTQKIKYLILVCICMLGAVFFLPDEILTRFEAIERVLFSKTSSVDTGSIGVRLDLWREAYELWLENPIFGVGPTNFSQLTYYTHIAYPHNLILELLAETGITYSLFFLFIMSVIFHKTSKLGKIWMSYFIVTSCFSGDISYMRFMLCVPLALVFLSEKQSIRSIS